MLIRDEAPLTVVAAVRGDAWIVPASGPAEPLGAGEVAIVRGPDPYIVADDPATPPQVVIDPGQRCSTPDGQPVVLADLGIRTWGTGPDGADVLLTGTYQMAGEVSRRLLDALPSVLVVRADVHRSALIPLLAAEVGHDRPGQQAVLDRLLDVLLIDVLRAWFARPDAPAPGWFRAHEDAVVGKALRLLHHRPDRPWTVATLAAATGVSRAALARRFTTLVGEPPMNYLTNWRLALAADLLRDPETTIGTVARHVGYSTPFALSAAFKRAHGVSPREYRLRATA